MPTDILLKLTTFNLFVKFIEQGKGSRQPKKMLKKKNKVYGISALKIYYSTTVIETLCYIRIDK